MLERAPGYLTLVAGFRWRVPTFFNIGVDTCDRWAESDPDRLAIIDIDLQGKARHVSFGALKSLSNRMANVLTAHGIRRGDRVAILLPQQAETAAAHIALYKMGAIAVPLSLRFGPDPLAFRLGHCGAKAVITNEDGAAKLPNNLTALTIDPTPTALRPGDIDLSAAMDTASERFEPVRTKADDPALIIYTSGTTGRPKGAVHGHRVLLGHLPGVEMSHDFFPHDGDLMWTPADWAWIGGLLVTLLPALHHGVPVIARRSPRLTGVQAFDLIARYGVRNALLPPSALRMMQAVKDPEKRWPLTMRSITAGGESLGADLLHWGRKTFGLTINESYGQTECNITVASCDAIMESRPGVMGRPVPGHAVAVIDATGQPVPAGQPGMIAVARPNPALFLGYWNDPAATAEKFIGDWMVTGDTGVMDENWWLRFIGRDDDVILTSGHRIGPTEVEECLTAHPAVHMAAVVGKPSPIRTQIIKAFIVPADGVAQSDALARELIHHTRTRLAAYQAPREIAFVETLPRTVSGKIIRRNLRALA